jgi:hypothetical protein
LEDEMEIDNTTKRKVIKFDTGGIWESSEWEVLFNEMVEYSNKPCHHCINIENICKSSFNKSWTCPRVIKVYNEGGYNSTGLCLDCVLENFKEK